MGTHSDVMFGALALRPGGGGVQTYSRELLAAIAGDGMPELRLSALCQRDAVDELPSGISPITRPVAVGAVRAVFGFAPMTKPSTIFHSLDVDLPVTDRSRSTVATVHDLSVFDTPWASSRVRARGEQALLRHAFRRADALIAVSQFTADRLAALFGRDSVVIPLAPANWAVPPAEHDVAAVVEKYSLPDKFVIQVGTVEPRKQVGLVAAACEQAGIPCVLAGAGSTGPDAPASAIGLGYVDLEDLPALYAAATVTVYASTYEGFGLPPVEAMACGGAVVASSVGALPDVVGDGAVLVARNDVDQWAQAISAIASDPGRRTELAARGRAVTSAWGWDDVARQTIEVYRRVGL